MQNLENEQCDVSDQSFGAVWDGRLGGRINKKQGWEEADSKTQKGGLKKQLKMGKQICED